MQVNNNYILYWLFFISELSIRQ